MKRFSYIFVCFSLAFLVGWYISGRKVRVLEREVSELSVRLAFAEEHPVVSYVHDSIPVYEYRVVEVDRTDYKQQLADKALIKELGLRVSELESENRQLLSVRDTVMLEPVVGDSVLEYRDNWSFFHYETASRVLDWEVRDSLSTFVSVDYRHHFLWWKWGKRGYKVDIVNYNPHSRVVYDRYIRIR